MVSEGYERTVAWNSGGDVHNGDAFLPRPVALSRTENLVNSTTVGDRHAQYSSFTRPGAGSDNPVRVRNRDGGESLP